MKALLLHQGKGMDNGEELPYIIGSLHRSEMEYPVACG